MDERSLFLAALDQPTPTDRDSWLREACGDNEPLRERVAALLAAHDSASSLLEQPAISHSLLPTQAFNSDTHPNKFSAGDVLANQTAILKALVKPSQQQGSLGRLGPYEILAFLGQGGMGVVLKGFDPKLNRQVAVKVLAPHLAANPESRQRFLREAQSAAKVHHPDVITIYAVDDGDPPYLAMELVDGESLQDRIDREGPLPVGDIINLTMHIATGLSGAHAEGLVHRDIKPANILIHRDSTRIKITDFGLARAVDDVALTGSGVIVGTPVFMSPEQAQGQPVDHRSDLFSLGCVIYAMAAGMSPFQHDSTIAVIRSICDDETKPLSEVNREIPLWLSQLVGKLLEKNPADRPGHAADVATACVTQAPVAPNTDRRGRDSANRNSFLAGRSGRSLAAVGALTLAAGLALIGLLGWSLGFWSVTDIPTQPDNGLTPAEIKKLANDLNTPRREPPRAKAPFSADEAQMSQLRWAEYLGVKVEFTDSIGMEYVLIPPGEFMMGSTPDQLSEVEKQNTQSWSFDTVKSEAPQHREVIEKPFYLAKYEVRVSDFRKFALDARYQTVVEKDDLGGIIRIEDGPKLIRKPGLHWRTIATAEDLPVGHLVLKDLWAYCAWLERQTGYQHVIPDEVMWEFACRAGSSDHWCDQTHEDGALNLGWFAENAEGVLQPVGKKKANAFGLHDMLGNAGELTLPKPANGMPTAERGGNVSLPVWLGRSSFRYFAPELADWHSRGFRVAIVGDLTKIPEAQASPTKYVAPATAAPARASAPFPADKARDLQEKWAAYLGIKVDFTNKVGMRFRLIPPGEYTFGMTKEQYEEVLASDPPEWATGLPREAEQRRVKINEPFYLGVCEVTVADFRRFAEAEKYLTYAERPESGGGRTNPNTTLPPARDPSNHWRNQARGENKPVGQLVLDDMRAYLAWLDRETGCTNTLPNEEQWEFACRAGTTAHWCDRQTPEAAAELGWFHPGDMNQVLHDVGQKVPNAYGLYDMLGNAGEWTWTTRGGIRVVERGGCVGFPVWLCRSTSHITRPDDHDWYTSGFRVAIVGDLTKIPEAQARGEASSRTPAKLPRPAVAVAPFNSDVAQDFQETWAAYLGVPVEFENLVGMKFRLIPPGTYHMGSTEAEVEEVLKQIEAVLSPTPSWMIEPIKTEAPRQQVTIGEPFYLGKFEVTRGLFERFVNEEKYQTVDEKSGVGGWNHSLELKWHKKPEYIWRNQEGQPTADHPVRWVAAQDIEEFCKWLGKDDHGTYLIPTEAEWEFACRAGTITPRYSTDPVLAKIAVCNDELKPVGTKPPNPFGLYDMLGNIQEVVRHREPSKRPASRGGYYRKWNSEAECRAAFRGGCMGEAYQGCVFEGYRIALVGDLKRVVEATAKRKAEQADK